MEIYNIQTDVVVVGAGLAGYRAALEVAAQGGQVCILEKLPAAGGSTVMSSGTFAFCGTDMQKESGINDSSDLLRQDFIDLGHGANDLRLVERYVEHQLAEYEYMRAKGVRFTRVEASSGQSVPRSHCADAREAIALLTAEAMDNPSIEVRLSTSAKRLIKDSVSSRIGGVESGGVSGVLRFHARRGVILTTGGFSRAGDLLKLFVPAYANALPAGGFGSVGDGIKMAWEHGGAIADVGYVSGTFGAYARLRPDELPTALLPIYKGAVAINMEGSRFIDESVSYKVLGAACLAQTDGLAFQIFDTSVMRQSVVDMPSFNFEAARVAGRLIAASSFEELARALQLPRDAFLNTMTAYNEDAGSGRDRQFGRRTLSHTLGRVVPLIEPPFYAYPCTTMLSSTYGGLAVDDHARVLDIRSNPIPGLYASGEIMGGFHGESYMTGSSLVKALVFARIAANSAMQN